jgi:GNAT superfamily N-acetyltransferase
MSVTAACASTVEVRAATRRDHPTIRAIIEAAYDQYRSTLETKLYQRYLADLLDLERHAARGRLLVAVLEEAVVGSVAVYSDATRMGHGWPAGWASGRGLAVHPAARRHGVAPILLSASTRTAAQHGATTFAFHTAEFMTEAIALYHRMGYLRTPEYDADFGMLFGQLTDTALRSLAFHRRIRTPGTSSPAYFLNRPAAFWRATLMRDAGKRPPARGAAQVSHPRPTLAPSKANPS